MASKIRMEELPTFVLAGGWTMVAVLGRGEERAAVREVLRSGCPSVRVLAEGWLPPLAGLVVLVNGAACSTCDSGKAMVEVTWP